MDSFVCVKVAKEHCERPLLRYSLHRTRVHHASLSSSGIVSDVKKLAIVVALASRPAHSFDFSAGVYSPTTCTCRPAPLYNVTFSSLCTSNVSGSFRGIWSRLPLGSTAVAARQHAGDYRSTCSVRIQLLQQPDQHPNPSIVVAATSARGQ